MSTQFWTWIFVILTFGTYITIAWRSRVKDTKGFYVAGQGVPTVANGAAVAADWMSAASFLSMAGIIAFAGYDGSVYLMGWTGGYVLLALLLAPYLRKFGKYTVPDFVGDRYSDTARLVAVVAAIFVSFTYVVGQMRGVGVVFSRFLDTTVTVGIMVGMGIVLFYAVLGGMKGITWTQVAQYSVLIVAYLIPAFAIAGQLTGIPIPHVSFGRVMTELNAIQRELGFDEYSSPFVRNSQLNVFLITASLMIGTAGLPHVIVRFYTTRSVRAARWSAFWALFFIALLYTTAPAVGVFAKYNLLQTVAEQPRADMPAWFDGWEETGLLEHTDLNDDGIIQYTPDEATNELRIDNDIMVLATPEVAGLPGPVIGLVVAGGLAAALSTASGLLLVISSSVAHDFYYRRMRPDATEKQRLLVGRLTMAGAVVIAGYFGVNPPGFVAEVVALAFGLAAASFFPTIVLGIFWKRANAPGAVAGMATGLTLTAAYMVGVLYLGVEPIFGISPQGIGAIGALINFAVTIAVTRATPPPPEHLQQLVDSVRYPSGVDAVTPEEIGR
ncbi:sodium:solute symporter family protein [Egicoccus sp. AB-alg6-2]|uniref:sodium:solute symporter family protein n=1 Tax=Egicoccus sp. AB-alg6-2 TaxID=3242692 RepID=UPI00359EC8EA